MILVFYALVSLAPGVGTFTVSNSTGDVTGTASSSLSNSSGLLNSIVPLAIAGLIELYGRLKDRNWLRKYKDVIVARPL